MTRTCKASHWLFALTLLGNPAPAVAYCDAIKTLADVHNQYFALVAYEGLLRQRAAARLYPIISSIDPETFLDEVDIAFDTARWHDVHAMASKISKDVTSGILYTERALAPHTDNIEWLRHFVSATPCDLHTTETQPSLPYGSDTPQTPIGAAPIFVPKPKAAENNALQTFLGVLSIVAIGFTAYRIWKSRFVRQFRADRLPRSTIELPFELAVILSDQTSDIRSVVALDVSLGGLKVKTDIPLEQAASLELHLPIGTRTATVVWSNPHYAGVLFDHQLSEDEFDDLLAHTKTAPGTSEAVKS